MVSEITEIVGVIWHNVTRFASLFPVFLAPPAC
jgi:hypothetical protein